MKKNIMGLLLGCVVLAATALTFSACEEEKTDDNPFVGTWTGQASIGGESAAATVTVTASAWTFVCTGAGMNETGTYDRSGNSATLKDGATTFGTATLSGGTLSVSITGGDYEGGSGTFTKQ